MTAAPSFTIRHAVPSDGEPVRAFVKAILWSYTLDADHDDLDVFSVPFNGALAELVAVRDGAVVGMAALWPRDRDVGWVSKLFVDPDHRGHGIGRALLAAIEDEARAWGLRAIGLSTLPQLKEAVRLYESMGWRRRSHTGHDRVYWRVLR